jgi:hypothetical protein
MRKLYEFFSPASVFASSQFSLPPYLDQTRQEAFRNKLVDNMKMLQTSISGLENVDERDRFGNNPALATERDKFLQDSSSVLTYCQIDLFPTVRALYTHLLTKEDATDLTPLLRDILPEEQSDGRRRSGGEEPPSRSPGRDSDVSVQHPRSEETAVSIISVGRSLLEELQEHQSKLNAYVKGYILSRERWVQCSEPRSKLEDGKGNTSITSKGDYWSAVMELLDKVKMDEIVPPSLADEFKKYVDIFSEELDNVIKEVEKVSEDPGEFRPKDIDSTIDRALRQMGKAMNAANSIAETCQGNAEKKLERIDQLIEDIFKHNEDRAKRMSEAIGTTAISAPPRQLQTESTSAQSRQTSGN